MSKREMTRRERLTALAEGRYPDRPAVKLWNCVPGQELLHPAYRPVYEAGVEKTDLFVGHSSMFYLYGGKFFEQHAEQRQEPDADPLWVHTIDTWHTPQGDLTSSFLTSTIGRPGYQEEYLLKEPDDLYKLLSLPYESFEFDGETEKFAAAERELGDRGVTMWGLDHAMYGLQRLIGSENFALWHLECPDLLLVVIEVFAGRIREMVQTVLENGVRPVIFGFVGPELCIPPLMSPASFDRYVKAVDQPLFDLIHNGGSHVWVHCHGKMGPILPRFKEMGVDILNPIEPPPMGDVTLEQAFGLAGDRPALEGNLEIGEIMTESPEHVRGLVNEALRVGAGKRFILCPTTGYMEDINPSARFIENLLLYINEGVARARALA